ncbi:winged helix-turn-helix domain-containing protein [Pseudonocardia asaccharolytica]
MWKLLRRHGWSAQVLAHRAVARDEAALGCGRSRCDRG